MRLLRNMSVIGSLLIGAGVAVAQDAGSTMQASYGNTTIITDGDTSYTAFYNEDGTFENSLGMQGTWELDGETLTLKVDGDVVGTTTLPVGKSVGDTFEMPDESGRAVTVTISAGRE